MKISIVDFCYNVFKIITITATAIIVLVVGLAIHSCLFDPALVFKCKVYHIYGKSEILYLTQKIPPLQPHWNRDQGWINDFHDPTICRIEIIQTDTIINYDRKRSY